MRRSIYVFGIFLIAISFANSQIPYISPGLGCSWDFSGHFILSPKVSIGVIQNGIFYNITVGRSSSSYDKYYPHYFVEAQCGKLTEPSDYKRTQLFYGGGIGLTIPTKNAESGVSLRVSAFTGFMAFLNATIIIKDKVQTELGGQVVMPIPLKHIDFGPIGG